MNCYPFYPVFLILVLLSAICRSQGFSDASDLADFSYTYGIGEYGGGPSFVDFNNDGLDDITITSGNFDSLYFYVNNGEGFDLIPSPIDNTSQTKQVLWVDTDNDYDLDCYVTSKLKNRLYINEGNLEFIDVTETCGFDDPQHQTFCSVWFDYNEDGLPDLLTSHRTAYLVGFITLYQNLGDNQFVDVTEEANLSVLGNSVLSMGTLDFNRDGLVDVHVGQDWDAGTMLLQNMGDGTFENVAFATDTYVENNSMSSSVGDYNNDGWMDLYVTNTNPGNSFFVNNGDGTYTESGMDFGLTLFQFTFSAQWIDAENDMDLDLYINGLNNNSGPNSPMMMNVGPDDPFVMVNDLWNLDDDGYGSIGNAIGDFNSDGYPDIVKMNSGAEHSLWENEFDDNNWLNVNLTGVESNSYAIGAEIEIIVGDVHQYRHVGCGGGFSSQNSYTQFFGLGENLIVDSLIVYWPLGLQTVLTNVEANQKLSILEILPEPGCTDVLACNFNPDADEDDGSCVYPEEFYDCDGNCLNDSDDDGVCDELEIGGCTDEEACNFDPEATEDDGSCFNVELYEISGAEFTGSGSTESYSYPITEGSSYEWTAINGEIVSGQGSNEVSVLCSGDPEIGEGVTLYLVETDSSSCIGDSVEFYVQIFFIGVEELTEDSFRIYPNPFSDSFNIQNISQDSKISIVDACGREVPYLRNKNEILLINEGSGFYILKVEFNEGRIETFPIIRH